MTEPHVTPHASGRVEAAGGVVCRHSPGGELEVLVIHRPHRKDWSLPKGKREPDETIVECAHREVHEETGFHCRLEQELPSTEYLDRKGRPKRVRYWVMHPVAGTFTPNAEVDEARWLSLDRACDLLTHDRDVPVLEALTDTVTAVA